MNRFVQREKTRRYIERMNQRDIAHEYSPEDKVFVGGRWGEVNMAPSDKINIIQTATQT